MSEGVLLAQNRLGVQSTLQSGSAQVYLKTDRFSLLTALLGTEFHFTVKGLRGNKGFVLQALQVLFLSRHTQEREKYGVQVSAF